MFPDTILITGVREELESVIEEGVVHIVQLLKNTETGRSSAIVKTNEKDGSKFDFNNKKKAAMKNNEWDSSKNFQNKRASKPGLQSSSREDSSDPDSTFNNLRDWTEDETATSQGTGDAADGKDEATAAGNNLKQFLDQSGSEARGKITSLLLEKGLLTNSVLNDLRAEWEESRKKSKSSSSTKFTDISDPPRK